MEDIKNFSIFIFEDDKIQATALKNYINEYSQDMHPVIAASTKEAISILSKEPYFRAYFLIFPQTRMLKIRMVLRLLNISGTRQRTMPL